MTNPSIATLSDSFSQGSVNSELWTVPLPASIPAPRVLLPRSRVSGRLHCVHSCPGVQWHVSRRDGEHSCRDSRHRQWHRLGFGI